MPESQISKNGDGLRWLADWFNQNAKSVAKKFKKNRFLRAQNIASNKEENAKETAAYYAKQAVNFGGISFFKVFEYLSRLANVGLIDNKILRNAEKAYSELDQDDKKFVKWLKRHSAIASYLSYWFAIALVSVSTWGGAKVANRGDQDDKDGQKKEIIISPDEDIDNATVFERSRSKIKFALAFVENYYPYVYFCGEAWTTGHGLTILYSADGKTTKKVTQKTAVPTLEESDKYKGRYLTYDVLPDVKNCIKVPIDENTLITMCVFRYCVGCSQFRSSTVLKQLNAGKTGAELAKYLTVWRVQPGVPKRLYFFAALMSGKISFDDLLYLRAEGCYNLEWQDIFVYENGEPKQDPDGFYEWDFSKIKDNLEKAKMPRKVSLKLERGKNGKSVSVDCKLVKEIVPEYIWQEVSVIKTKPQSKMSSHDKKQKFAMATKKLQYTQFDTRLLNNSNEYNA